jgi:hypothetical protein
MAFPPVFDNTWDITQPPDTQLANLLGQDLRNLKDDVMQRLSLLSGTFANRPTPETVNATWGGAGFGILYFSTDTSQIFQWNGASWVDVTSSFTGTVKLEAQSTTPVTVTNTTVLSPLITFNLPANEISRVGQALRFTGAGYQNGASGGGGIADYILGIGIDGALLGSAGLLENYAVAGAAYWMFNGSLLFSSAGSGGQYYMTERNTISNNINGNPIYTTPALLSLDTTVSHTIGIYVQWQTANINNSITENILLVERLG